MNTLNLVRNNRGFTLIELMVVVGIIGILASIAAPNFSKYQAKSRQSEAKIGLSAIYNAEKSFFSEYNAYVSNLDAVGYAPEGQKRMYNIGFLNNTNNPTNTTIGFGGDFGAGNIAFAAVNNSITGCTGTLTTAGNITSAGGQSFFAGANGCIRSGAAADAWSITDTKILSNYAVGI